MPSWHEVLEEIRSEEARRKHPIDTVRRKYLRQLHEHTGRNVIAYYSGWLSQTKPHPSHSVNDEDKNAFMATIHEMDRSLGLDLILHTPGGDLAAAESLVDYLRRMFGTNIRAIVPQLAMSAGTMIACSCKTILMGKESNLGPIDPQIGGLPANGVIAEFNTAAEDIKGNPHKIPLWQAIIGKYHPSFLGQCQHALDWSEKIVKEWLLTCMLEGKDDAEQIADNIIKGLSDSDSNFAHARHIHLDTLKELGLDITDIESDDRTQDLVLTVHHAYINTFSMTPATKIVENHNGVAMVRALNSPD